MLSPGSTAKAHRGSPVRLASATTNFPSTTLTPVLRSFMREGLSVTQTTAIQGLATDLDVLAGVRHHHAPPHPLSRVSMHDSRRTAEPCMHDPIQTAMYANMQCILISTLSALDESWAQSFLLDESRALMGSATSSDERL